MILDDDAPPEYKDLPKVWENRKAMKMQQFQVNKYLRMLMSAIVTATGAFIFFSDNVNWNGLLGPKSGAAVVMIIGLVKIAYASFAPGMGKTTVPTNSTLITQVVPEGHTQPQV